MTGKLLLSLLLVMIHPTSVLPAETLQPIPELQIVTEGLKPVSYVNPTNGEMAGFASQYTKDILALTDITYQFNVYPWTRTYKIAQTVPNVFVILIARTERREHKFIWFEQVLDLDFYLYGLESRRNEISRTDGDYRHNKVGVIRNDFNHEEILAMGYTNVVAAENNKVLVELLRRGRVDFIVSSNGAMKYFDIGQFVSDLPLYRAKSLEFLNSDIYTAFSLGTDQRIISQMTKAAKILKQDPDYIKPDID